jgi:hypothetical protein
MLEGRVILEVGVRRKTDRRVLTKIVLVDERIVVANFSNVWALAALESSYPSLLEGVETIVAVGAEIHVVYPYIPKTDGNSFFTTHFHAFKTGSLAEHSLRITHTLQKCRQRVDSSISSSASESR